MPSKPRKGDTFYHASLMDTTWTPEPGQTFKRDAPKARMIVTAVRKGVVYYNYLWAGSKPSAFQVDLDKFLETYGDQL